MTEEQYHVIHTWFNYASDLQRRKRKRQHVLAALSGLLTVLVICWAVYVLAG